MSNSWPLVPLGDVLKPVSRPEPVDPEKTYRILGAHWYAHGLYIKDTLTGAEIRADKVFRVEEGDFVYNRLFAWKGSFAVATKENDGCYVSKENRRGQTLQSIQFGRASAATLGVVPESSIQIERLRVASVDS